MVECHVNGCVIRVEVVLARQMGLVMRLHDRDDVSGAVTTRAKEIIHRVTRHIRFERVDLLPEPAVGIGGTVVADVAAPRNGDVRATGLGVENAIVGFSERAVVHPEVAHRAAVADRDEIPVIPVILSLGRFVPFKILVELQVADDDIVATFDVEVAMFDGRAVGREDGQPALGLMSIKLSPTTKRTGCSKGGLFSRNGPTACTAEPTSFQPRLKLVMISMTLTEPAVL